MNHSFPDRSVHAGTATLASVLRMNTRLLLNCLQDVSEAHATQRPNERTNSIAFIACHVVDSRFFIARYLGGAVAGMWAAPAPLRTPRLGRALLAQGGVAVALALNYRQVYPDLRPNLVLTAALLSVLLFEVVATAETARFLDQEHLPRPADESAMADR